MYLREVPSTTLADVREQVNEHSETIQVAHSDINVDLLEERRVDFGNGIEVPVTEDGVQAFASWLDIPSKFMDRMDADIQQHLITTLLERNPGNVAVVIGDDGIRQMRDPRIQVIPTSQLVDVATRVIDPSAPVVEWWRTGDEFRLDVMAPDNFDRGIGGDPAVGDITRGGIRIGQDLKHNLAPWAQPWAFRLICTNGMEIPDRGLKVDARGQTVDEVLAEFEAIADRAFRRVESDISAFYDLRTRRVENPERTLIRMAEERGLPDRTILRLVDRIPALTNETGGVITEFDLVNLMTNQANDPGIRRRAGARRALELAGGAIVTEHAERCGHCQSKLN
jgi:hypothetical protein